MKVKSEDIQYMRFDSEGNLYLYEPGSGISGEPCKVIQMGSDEVIYEDKIDNKNDEEITGFKFDSVKLPQMHRIVPQKAKSVGKDTKHDVR